MLIDGFDKRLSAGIYRYYKYCILGCGGTRVGKTFLSALFEAILNPVSIVVVALLFSYRWSFKVHEHVSVVSQSRKITDFYLPFIGIKWSKRTRNVVLRFSLSTVFLIG
jgi:hypothetical protein